MLICETFPDLTEKMMRDLRRLRRDALADQMKNLHLVDRCRCGSTSCGTFYTAQADSRARRSRRRASTILQCGVIVTEVGGRIVEVETLDPVVESALRRLIP